MSRERERYQVSRSVVLDFCCPPDAAKQRAPAPERVGERPRRGTARPFRFREKNRKYLHRDIILTALLVEEVQSLCYKCARKICEGVAFLKAYIMAAASTSQPILLPGQPLPSNFTQPPLPQCGSGCYEYNGRIIASVIGRPRRDGHVSGAPPKLSGALQRVLIYHR